MTRAGVTYVLLVVVQRGIGFLLFPLFARAMPVAEFGAAALLMIGNILIVTVLGGPLEQTVFRWTARRDLEPGSATYLATARVWLVVLAPALSLLAAGGLWWSDGRILQVSTRLWALEALAAALMLYVTSYALVSLRASERLRCFVVVSLTSVVTLVVSKVGFILVADMGVLGWVISDLVTAAAAYLVAIITVSPFPLEPDRQTLRPWVRSALPMLPHTLSLWAMNSLSRPLGALFLPLSVVGMYAAGYNLAFVGQILLLEINRAIQPRFARAGGSGSREDLYGASRWILWLAAVLTCVVALGAAPAELFYLPDAYAGVRKVMVVLSLLTLAYGTYLVSLNFIIVAHGDTRLSWLSPVVGVATMSLLILVRGETQGALWLAFAAVTGHAAMGVSEAAIAVYRDLRLDPRACGLTPSFLGWVLSAVVVAGGASWLELGVAGYLACVLVVTGCLAVGRPRRPTLVEGAVDGPPARGR